MNEVSNNRRPTNDKPLGSETLPALSFIVPFYNAAETLPDCLNSLLAIDYPAARREIVCVDNNSTDKGREIAGRFHPEVTLLEEPVQGAAAARNCGIRNTQAPLIVFIDADCVVDAQWARRLVNPLVADPALAAVGGRILARPSAGRVGRFGNVIHDHQKAIEVLRPPYLITMNMAVRRAVLDAVGLFDESFGRAEDSDLSYRLYLGGHRLHYAADAIVYHHNPERLTALFKEGCLHGMWHVKLQKKYASSLLRGRKRVRLADYRHLGGLLVQCVSRNAETARTSLDPLCELTFRSGKKTGMLIGSIRFRYFTL